MSTALHIVAICLVFAGLVWACRWVHRRSRLAGVMFAAGLVIRAAGALFFVAVSYFRLPFMTSLQLGNGFWVLASDAQEFYRMGSLAAEHWYFGRLEALSPGYVGPLAWWMRAVGVNPASPPFFSLALYAVSVVALVAAFGRARTRESQQAVAVGVAALSFSPMLIFSAIFGLKDVFVTTLIVLLAIAYLTLIAAVWTRATFRANLLAAAGALCVMWLMTATRTYLAILVWSATAVACAGSAMAAGASRLRRVMHAAVVLTALGIVVVAGAESNYPEYLRVVIVSKLPASIANLIPELPGGGRRRHPPASFAGLDELDRRRDAITDYGGDSVFNSRESNTPGDRLAAVAIGLAAVFIPSTILGGLSIVDIHIRTAARLVADADTLALDLTIGAVLWLLIVNRRQIDPVPLVFGLALTLLIALPLGYVMTNYGTLVRLRLMVETPVWLTLLALVPRSRTRRSAGTPAPSPER